MVVELWRRHEAGEKLRSDFETKLGGAFAAIGSHDAKSFNEGLKQYLALRRSGRAECLFDDCLGDAATKGPINGEWVAEVILREGLKFAGQILFHHSEGKIGPGQVRLWPVPTCEYALAVPKRRWNGLHGFFKAQEGHPTASLIFQQRAFGHPPASPASAQTSTGHTEG